MRAPVSVKRGMEMLVSHSGLLHIGALLDSMQLKDRLNSLDNVHCVDPTFSHADVLFSMIGLISVGKPDYEAIEIFRPKQDFFHKSVEYFRLSVIGDLTSTNRPYRAQLR